MSEIVRTQFANQPLCRICGKALDDHSLEENWTCAKAEQAQVPAKVCPSCGRTYGQHSDEEIRACARKQRNQGKSAR
jgi:hypothetical protein